MKRLLFLVSSCDFFLSHRVRIAVQAMQSGYTVAVACPSSPSVENLHKFDIVHIPIKLQRGSINPLSQLNYFFSILQAILYFRPDLVHAITAKPIILGGLAARLLNIPIVAAITGLGHVFIHRSILVRSLRFVMMMGFRLVLNHRSAHVIYQNRDDWTLFSKRISNCSWTIVPGSGVDLHEITPQPLPDGNVVVVLPARLLKDKGVVEFVEAARRLQARGCRAVFRLLGDPDEGNPTSISRAQLEQWVAEKVVEWSPFTSDIGSALAQAHLVVLPSYREGFPKTLIDAAAAGRASAASDVPGCRDAIIPGETGELFRAMDAEDMARVIGGMIERPDRLAEMGRSARGHAEKNFDIADVVGRHLEIYQAMAVSKSA